MDIFAYSMLCFTSLFTLMDPLGVMPVFLQMTEGMSAGERRSIALKSCALTFVILVLFTLCGRFLFHFFGISTNGFRITGGIIIFKIGYDMLQAHFTHVKLNENEKKEYSRNITVTPLAVPMLCGPGVISSGITLMEDAPEYIFKIALVCVIALVCLLSFIILCVSTRLLKILGETGNNVMMRLMGLILMVIAVECFINGMQPVLTDILRQAHACP
ncbi:NAAT family transporter [Bacteroides ovatus]|jgi:multiple antibiotic resistance protein|uniref:MarC family protein n=1 Tax=Bacteroides TaxID=816 RepID=UPI000B374678|nr:MULTISPECIES: MarC family protein [Bacteroides]MBS6337238.1 NAAT family transporter [Bacteroides ovatus]MBU9881253.1 MarC family protein [Bacteroides sp. MSK.20.82]MDC7166346.1 MarC family protein [Bacteroides uniformis]OUP94823.1 antibiotic resistance protein MarC [Bacteroides ovatus]RHI49679.1 NAAT family transporter [Bacteroides ovatus]